MHNFTLAEIVILIALTISAITDVRTKKIYNVVTIPTALAGLVINGIDKGWAGAGAALFGWLLAVGINLLPKPSQKIAFGDAKMFGAVGACLLPIKMLICWFYFSLTWGALALFLIARAIPKDQIKGFWLMFKTFFTAGIDLSSTVDTTDVNNARKAKIPIAPAILVGTLLGILFDKPLMHFMGFNWYQ